MCVAIASAVCGFELLGKEVINDFFLYILVVAAFDQNLHSFLCMIFDKAL